MLQSRIEYQFKNPALLHAALTHPSKWTKSGRPSSYERLEFLGDRVLGLVIAETLLERFPKDAEGPLAKRLAGLVREEALARIAVNIDLVVSLNVAGDDSECSPSMLADACEALIGAIYQDGGIEPARAFILKEWTGLLAENLLPPEDPKNALQEWVQARGMDLPMYEIIDQKGPAHAPHFTVQVSIAGYEPATGEGASRRAAEKQAALAMLEIVKASK